MLILSLIIWRMTNFIIILISHSRNIAIEMGIEMDILGFVNKLVLQLLSVKAKIKVMVRVKMIVILLTIKIITIKIITMMMISN